MRLRWSTARSLRSLQTIGDDCRLRRPHVPVGTRKKMVDSRNDVNPSGHGVIFLAHYENEGSGEHGEVVLCFVPGSGV
jgi:hypothetical protein